MMGREVDLIRGSLYSSYTLFDSAFKHLSLRAACSRPVRYALVERVTP